MSVDLLKVGGDSVSLDGEAYYRITNSHLMADFFMSLVGAGDHWMFISSNGALTTGRRNADQALFPYAPDDQISAARGETGSTTLVKMEDALWEPFAAHAAGTDHIRRNLYKTPLGNKLVFEEINETQQLAFRYRWTFSQRFGFVRTCRLENLGDQRRSVELVDGLRNVLPPCVGNEFFVRYSNLANAYKKSELVPPSQLGLYYLSSVPTDRAEPSEGLRTNTVWQTGLTPNAVLLSSEQLAAFRKGAPLETESDVRGKAGAFLAHQSLELQPGEAIQWHVVAELNQDHRDVVNLDHWLQQTTDISAELDKDIAASEQAFLKILSSSDAVQCGSNTQRNSRHLSNTIFNVMRGGIPLDNYRVQASDFADYVSHFNHKTADQHHEFLTTLPEALDVSDLRHKIAGLGDPHLTRLSLEYLPLAFSRRHGDPTRPWNHFSIELQSKDGATNLNYQGNWRDIFQNWEGLALSFPDFLPAMISRFVNATTADGYNPYRLTRNGFDWEAPSPDDPWANIGYWGDHQIIYLLKLLEWSRDFAPQGLDALLNAPAFTHANVPYRIKPYEQIRENVQDTIEFDTDLAAKIADRVEAMGADGKLLANQEGEIHYVTLLEKILTLSLAKLSNFIPDGGIWLNTQRPEWNDANNALVGNGVSMVTACYLYRWMGFFEEWLSQETSTSFDITEELAEFFAQIDAILHKHQAALQASLNPALRLQIVEELSKAGGAYRQALYAGGVSGRSTSLSKETCLAFFKQARQCLATTVRNNERTDGLFHSYNLLDWEAQGLEIEHLDEMLEGQVAVLSSGILAADEAVKILDALRSSALYRENQDSYILYPDRQLPRFLQKNQIGKEFAESNTLLKKLLAEGDRTIVSRDVNGGLHFHGDFRNAADLKAALEQLKGSHAAELEESGAALVQEFENLFGHRQFTGRSGTFFAYEGLGSIYWHMVSKLGLAVCENYFWAIDSGAEQATIDSLERHYQAVRRGIGAEKSPLDYGAFPSDPYSHTPENAGVKQPGMTGQVKEDLLARFAELGIHVADGCLRFRLDLFDPRELLSEARELTFYNLDGALVSIKTPEKGFGFTLFQVPIVYRAGESDAIELELADGSVRSIEGLQIDAAASQALFSRSGEIKQIVCTFRSLLSR